MVYMDSKTEIKREADRGSYLTVCTILNLFVSRQDIIMAYKDPEYHKKWYQKNKEKQLKYSEIYYQEHREQKGEYYEENKEKILKRMREYHKKYYQKHKKKILKQT